MITLTKISDVSQTIAQRELFNKFGNYTIIAGAPGPYGFQPSPRFVWSLQDKHQFLDVQGNGTEIFYSGNDHEIVEEEELGPIVKADRPIPKQGQFYFEVTIANSGENNEIAVGICTKSSPLDRFPGWVETSFGYHGDDGNIFCESEDPTYCPENPFRDGETVGVMIDYNTLTLTFSKQKVEVQKIQLHAHHRNVDFYPCVGISSPGAIVRLAMPSGRFIILSFFYLSPCYQVSILYLSTFMYSFRFS